MKKFKVVSNCIKCGYANPNETAKIEYIPANGNYGGMHDEYIKRTCRRCGFAWRELPLNMEAIK